MEIEEAVPVEGDDVWQCRVKNDGEVDIRICGVIELIHCRRLAEGMLGTPLMCYSIVIKRPDAKYFKGPRSGWIVRVKNRWFVTYDLVAE